MCVCVCACELMHVLSQRNVVQIYCFTENLMKRAFFNRVSFIVALSVWSLPISFLREINSVKAESGV